FGSGGSGAAGVPWGGAGAPAADDVTVGVSPTLMGARSGPVSAGLGVGPASTCVARLPRKLVRTSGEIDTSTATRTMAAKAAVATRRQPMVLAWPSGAGSSGAGIHGEATASGGGIGGSASGGGDGGIPSGGDG